MKILIIGGGGREHALVWKTAQSPKAEKVYCIPGNPGIAEIAECCNISTEDFPSLTNFVRDEKIGLTIVGPEAPLVSGIVDYFNKEGLRIFGPSKEAARLEGSKVFAKEMMKKYGVPTAGFKIFDTSARAAEYIKERGAPIVIKADGLAAGKGAIVAKTVEEAIESAIRILDEKIFGDAGSKIVVEDCLKGEESSMLAFIDETSFAPLVSSQDHKQVYDGDRGPNTGGMGAYAPAPLVDGKIQKKVNEEVFSRMVRGLQAEGIKYNGILYAGLMIDGNNINVLEFNVRFGDPETQAILPLMETDLVDAVVAAADNKLGGFELKWSPRATCVCVVLASGGYPESYEKGKEIKGLEDVKDAVVFHAGTALKDGKIVTSGGRVLGVTAVGADIRDAQRKAYDAAGRIHFDKMHYRKDIGNKALKYI
jgi:phosphoribosylamine--glycine ligase